MGNSFPFPSDETSRSVCVWFRNKRDLIEQFIDSLDHSDDVEADWRAYIAKKREAELTAIIEDEKLDNEGTHELVERAFRGGGIPESGTEVVDLMTKKPSRFGGGTNNTIIQNYLVSSRFKIRDD